MSIIIADVIRNGILFDMKNWGNSSPNFDNFSELIAHLFEILNQRNVNYVLVGGVALLSYVEGRNTQDIDFILSSEDLKSLPEIAIDDQNKDFIRGNFQGLQIDILVTRNKLFQKVVNDFVTRRNFGGKDIRCVTVDGLCLLKFYALPSLYRQGNFDRASLYENDLLLLMLNYSIDLKKLFKILKSYLLPTDLEEIESIATEIQQRIRRFSRQQQRLKNDEMEE